MLRRSIHGALLSDESDKGERAGEIFMELARDRGIEAESSNMYDLALNHAMLADILTTHLSGKGEVRQPDPVEIGALPWSHICLENDNYLRRVVTVDHWTEDRLRSEVRSWYCLGEICMAEKPMEMTVLVIGHLRADKRHSPWCKGLIYPGHFGKIPRFKKKHGVREGFSEKWIEIWRHDHDEISRSDWLKGMAQDDVFKDFAMTFRIEVPSEEQIAMVRETARVKAEAIADIKDVPPMTFSSCYWPVRCGFSRMCWDGVPLSGGSFVKK